MPHQGPDPQVTSLFLYGRLLDPGLRHVVFGGETRHDPVPARLSGFTQAVRLDDTWPVLLPLKGSEVDGAVLHGLTEADLVALDHHEAVMGLVRHPLPPGSPAAFAYLAQDVGNTAGPWDPAQAWPDGVAILQVLAQDVMALCGQQAPAAIRARLGALLVRAASRHRAEATPAPTALRRRAEPGDVALADWRQPYARFFAVEEYDLAFRRFDGSMSPAVTRAAFVSGDAVIVLPYDPHRDRVLLVEQFRAGPYARGDREPWQMEAVAGRIDPGEMPEDAARREAVEEAGLTLKELLPVSACYASPGAKSEFLYSYVGLCDLPDGAAGLFGLADEAEDIRGHLLGFDALMALVASGEIATAPVLLTIYWLALHRDRLRATAG